MQIDSKLLKDLLQVMQEEEWEDFWKEMVGKVCQELLQMEIT